MKGYTWICIVVSDRMQNFTMVLSLSVVVNFLLLWGFWVNKTYSACLLVKKKCKWLRGREHLNYEVSVVAGLIALMWIPPRYVCVWISCIAYSTKCAAILPSSIHWRVQEIMPVLVSQISHCQERILSPLCTKREHSWIYKSFGTFKYVSFVTKLTDWFGIDQERAEKNTVELSLH